MITSWTFKCFLTSFRSKIAVILDLCTRSTPYQLRVSKRRGQLARKGPGCNFMMFVTSKEIAAAHVSTYAYHPPDDSDSSTEYEYGENATTNAPRYLDVLEETGLPMAQRVRARRIYSDAAPVMCRLPRATAASEQLLEESLAEGLNNEDCEIVRWPKRSPDLSWWEGVISQVKVFIYKLLCLWLANKTIDVVDRPAIIRAADYVCGAMSQDRVWFGRVVLNGMHDHPRRLRQCVANGGRVVDTHKTTPGRAPGPQD